METAKVKISMETANPLQLPNTHSTNQSVNRQPINPFDR
jgi:hypothetical protein